MSAPVKEQDWIFSVTLWADGTPIPARAAVVGSARASTVEAALHLAGAPEDIRAEIRRDETVRKFVEGALDHEARGYYVPSPFPASQSWLVCIGSIHEVLR